MRLFNLPKSTEVGRVVPKNAFEEYINSKQRKVISDSIKRITWTHKLSRDTTNLNAIEINEIQFFLIELKLKTDLKKILHIIDRSIPYHIIFILYFGEEIFISTSAKHDHITKLNGSVIDCTFRVGWIKDSIFDIPFILKDSLDYSYMNFCCRITNREIDYNSYSHFVKKESKIIELEKNINTVQRQIKKEKQFNRKVELNMELKQLHNNLREIIEKY